MIKRSELRCRVGGFGCSGAVVRSGRRNPGPRRPLRAHSCPHRHQFSAHQPQIGQREQRVQLRGVLGQSSVADLGMSELALDHPERVFDLGADAGLDLLDLLGDRLAGVAHVQYLAFARAHRHVPVHAGPGIGPLVSALVTRVAERIGFLAVQQRVGLDHVAHAAGRASHGVHQSGLRIHADVGLHAEVPLLALLALLHLRVALAAGVLGRTRCRDQRGVHHRARAQHQTLVAQDVVDCDEDLGREFVRLQQVAKAQDRALVGQARGPVVQAGELAVHRHLVQRFFHRRVTQPEPLLQEMNAQHCLDGKRRTTATALGRVGHDQCNQLNPRHHAVHLVEEHALARALGRQVQSEVGLLHGSDRRWLGEGLQARPGAIYADLP
jgi:hypothetical protein